jgi:hypothetical protein
LELEALEDRRLLSFSPGISYSVDANPGAAAVGYFNNDSLLDLAVTNQSSNTVSILLGSAGGAFQPAQSFATGTSPRSLAVGDFNKDGNFDIATANSGDVSVLLGDGAGGLGAANNIDFASLGSSPASVAVGDFNIDGKLDLAVTTNTYVFDGYGYYGGRYYHYEGHANVLLGTGTGSFGAPIDSYLGYGIHASAAVADFNGDHNLDIASVSTYYGTIDVALGNGAGSVGGNISIYTGSAAQSVAAGDVNADNHVDLVTSNSYGNSVSVSLGAGNGAFGPGQNFAAGSQPQSVAMAYFNGDDKIDLVTANADVGTISVLLGAGNGAFKLPVNAAVGSYPLGVAVGDFNGDSRPDVVSANFGSANVSVLLNDGTWPGLDAPSITVNDVTVTEGNSGITSATFTVSLSAAYGQPLSVHYDTLDGSATLADNDYQAASGTLTFNPGGLLTQTFTVQVVGDRLAEYGEYFSVRLTSPTNAFVADAQGVGSILDDEPYVSIVDSVSGSEGNTGTTTFTFSVTLSAAYDAPVTVDFASADLTPDEQYWYGPGATAGVDYTATFGTLTFNPGQPLTQNITVLVKGDRLAEPSELFFVNLSNPTSAHLSSSQALGVIVDDEPYLSISGGGTVVEGNSGTKSMTFTVTLSAAYDAPVTVVYATADGSATLAGGDYQSKTATLTFNPGQPLTQNFTVLINGDRLGESDEYLSVNLTDATNASIGGGTGYGTIQDDEPRISISNASVKEGNSGTKLVTFTVRLSAAYDQAVTASYATHDDSATVADNDYIATSGMLTFAAGQTTKTFTVTIRGDKKRETDESFYVLLSGASSNALISNAYGWFTIINDDFGKGGGKRKPNH